MASLKGFVVKKLAKWIRRLPCLLKMHEVSFFLLTEDWTWEKEYYVRCLYCDEFERLVTPERFKPKIIPWYSRD